MGPGRVADEGYTPGIDIEIVRKFQGMSEGIRPVVNKTGKFHLREKPVIGNGHHGAKAGQAAAPKRVELAVSRLPAAAIVKDDERARARAPGSGQIKVELMARVRPIRNSLLCADMKDQKSFP